MDDTKRPENLVHMDMPGWSTTYGLVSNIKLKTKYFNSEIQLNTYSNLSIAEMRMYPQNRNKRIMFAYSWPWITTSFLSVASNNVWKISDESEFHLGTSVGINRNHSKYVEFNRVFNPYAPQEKVRFLPSLNASYSIAINRLNFTLGAGYGHRAPSVSEGYGYYIYNSFDRYDYIGNPNLKNEISYESNIKMEYKISNRLRVQTKFNYFYIKNYIVGKILNTGSPMNYQSVGVKAYTALDYAMLFNFSTQANYILSKRFHWNALITYARATDNEKNNLPFIRPLSYQTALHYRFKTLEAMISTTGDMKQIHFSPEYGESQKPAYNIWNFSVNYSFSIRNVKASYQIGAENLFNKYYSTYADWGNIPRIGRNIFTSLKINL